MILCVDVGGTNTRIGLSRDGASFFETTKFGTGQEFSDEINRIVEEVKGYSKEIDKIFFATAGVVQREKGELVWWSQYPKWNNTNVFSHLQKYFPNASMRLENDAASAALGEAVYGAGKEYSVVSWFTLSTGIGGGLVIDKEIVRTRSGFEPGHQIVISDGAKWHCGQRGCFESIASGTAFKKKFGVAAEDCTDEAVWNSYSKLLALGLTNIIALWSPEVIILGGGVSQRIDYFLNPLKEELKRNVTFTSLPDIKKTVFDEPGLYGGLASFRS